MARSLLNLTPHALTIYLPDGTTTEIPAHPTTVRAVTAPQMELQLPDYPKLPVSTRQEFTGLEGLPEKTEEVDIIVSRVVAEVMLEMGLLYTPEPRVFVPDTGPKNVVRDARKQIIGVRNLELWSKE